MEVVDCAKIKETIGAALDNFHHAKGIHISRNAPDFLRR